MPELESLRPALARQGIDLVGLNVDADADADVRGFLRDYPVGYPVLVGGVPLIESIYATDQLSVPLSILVDEGGLVAEIIPGWSNETRARFAALAGTEASTAAQNTDARKPAPKAEANRASSSPRRRKRG
jgi:hypothetical protein